LAWEVGDLPQNMTPDTARAFLAGAIHPAVLVTVRPDGRPHAVPVWFALDGDDLLVSISENSVKGRDLLHDPRVAVLVDDETPPYAFVMVEGVAEMSRDPGAIRDGAFRIGRRYLGEEGAGQFVSYATGPSNVLVRIRPTRLVAQDHIAG
jgi:PPOX class probable F420-dependent enzyme